MAIPLKFVVGCLEYLNPGALNAERTWVTLSKRAKGDLTSVLWKELLGAFHQEKNTL